MANLSTATGEIAITSDAEKCVDALLKAFKYVEDGDYNTLLVEEDTGRKSLTEFISKFDGSGRWSYDNNIERFNVWALPHLSDKDKKILKDNDWKINYVYTDYDPGCDWIVKNDIDYIHKKNNDYNDANIVYNSNDGYDYNLVNLTRYVYDGDLYETINNEYELYCMDDAERFLDDLEECKDELLDYLECSFEELLNSNQAFESTYYTAKEWVENGN